MGRKDDELQARLAELQEKQTVLVEKAGKLSELADGEDVAREGQALAKEILGFEEEAKQLEADWKAHGEEQSAGINLKPRVVKVQLTDDQRKQITEETGRRIEVVELEDGTDVHERLMPDERPEYIMGLARKKAELENAEKDGQARAQEAARAVFAELENSADPNMQLKAAEMKKNNPDLRKALGLDD